MPLLFLEVVFASYIRKCSAVNTWFYSLSGLNVSVMWIQILNGQGPMIK